jgi:FemAB-related protein (PEP-CTERM system-associated)
VPLTASARAIATPVSVTADVSPDEWNRFVEAHRDSTHCHLWGWRHVFEGVFGQRCEYLVARGDEGIRGVLPLVRFNSRLFGRAVISLPYLNDGGLLADDEATSTALLDGARQIGLQFDAAHVELRHRRRMAPALPNRDHKVAMTMPLHDPAAMWDALDRKVRNQVRKAQKSELETAVGRLELVDEFYAVFADNMRDLGTPVYPKRLFAEILRTFPAGARIFVVRHQGRPVAASFTCAWRDVIEVPWASSLRAYRHLCPNMLLYWTMIETAAAEGRATFDFGRSTPDAGTFHFKVQWGAQPSPLHWEYVLLKSAAIPDHGPTNPKFSAAIELWKRLPLWLTTGVGPAIVRHIP